MGGGDAGGKGVERGGGIAEKPRVGGIGGVAERWRTAIGRTRMKRAGRRAPGMEWGVVRRGEEPKWASVRV